MVWYGMDLLLPIHRQSMQRTNGKKLLSKKAVHLSDFTKMRSGVSKL